MKKNEFDVPVDWGKLSSHKPAKHSKSDKQIYWAKIRMASKKKKFNIDEEQNKMEEKYQKYLEMSYEDFFNATHMYSRYDGGDYIYAVSKENDDKESRLSYIDYLTKEKGYEL